ncbi:unnamed protein product [Mucor hiemalis]
MDDGEIVAQATRMAQQQNVHSQSKNLQSNCSILNELFIRSGGKINELVAMNFIVEVLFKWKDFLCESIRTLKKSMMEQQLCSMVRSSTPAADIPATPPIFFTPKSNRIKESMLTEEDGVQEED